MPILTTKLLGLDEKDKADPRPVTGINYAGQPMKPGEFYNGRPEHMDPEQRDAVVEIFDHGHEQPVRRRKPKRKSHWTPEKRAAFAQRMRNVAQNYWSQRKAAESPQDSVATSDDG
jgi:hypothetical protein